MVAVTYSADVDHIDDQAYEAEAERPGEPIRIRIQPSIFRKAAGAQGQHRAWLDVSWMLECKDAKEAIALREAMRIFFEQVGEKGAEAVRQQLIQEAA
jgi:hypothetical protein